MSLNEPLSAELEAQAQELAARIRARADSDILALARLLVSKSDAEVFGDTEFEARHIVHHLGAAALEERLKKARLRGIGHRLPHLSAGREVPGLPPENAVELAGTGPLRAGLLLLRPLRAGPGPLGSSGRPDVALVHPGHGATGLPRRHLERRL